jgi:hypothetical protein
LPLMRKALNSRIQSAPSCLANAKRMRSPEGGLHSTVPCSSGGGKSRGSSGPINGGEADGLKRHSSKTPAGSARRFHPPPHFPHEECALIPVQFKVSCHVLILRRVALVGEVHNHLQISLDDEALDTQGTHRPQAGEEPFVLSDIIGDLVLR